MLIAKRLPRVAVGFPPLEMILKTQETEKTDVEPHAANMSELHICAQTRTLCCYMYPPQERVEEKRCNATCL